MSSKPKPKPPKLIPLSAEQFRKFHPVRSLCTQAQGQLVLLSHNRKKYLQKELPACTSFLSTRPTPTLFTYSTLDHHYLILPLVGEPLSDLQRQHVGPQTKQWLQHCGGMEPAMLNLIQYLLSIHMEMGVDDVLVECLRVGQGRLHYCYDTWMRGTLECVAEGKGDVEGYLLSERELGWLVEGSTKARGPVTWREYGFKVGLLVLGLAMPEVKIRNYQYGHYSINWANIHEKVRVFGSRMANRELIEIVTKCINGTYDRVDQPAKVLNKNRSGSSSVLNSTNTKKTHKQMNRSISKSIVDKQNISFMCESRKNIASSASKDQLSVTSDIYSSVSKLDMTIGGNARRIRLKSRANNGADNEVNISSNAQSKGNQHLKGSKSLHIFDENRKKPYSLRQTFARPPDQGCSRVLDYLCLTEHIIESTYQSSVINCLQNVRIKAQWRHKIYPNGSIYLGDFQAERRHGKGLYLFESQQFYYGEWSENTMHGFGTYVFKSGEYYCGNLKKGAKEGSGRFFYKDGRIYDGNWHQNCKAGFGTVLFPNGVKFLGFFRKNCDTYGIFTQVQNGQAAQTYGHLQNYNWSTGSFVETKLDLETLAHKLRKHCPQVNSMTAMALNTPRPCNYQGEVKQGKANGYGISQNQTQVYEGQWQDNRYSGQGKLTVKNKYEIKGRWSEGILIEYTYK